MGSRQSSCPHDFSRARNGLPINLQGSLVEPSPMIAEAPVRVASLLGKTTTYATFSLNLRASATSRAALHRNSCNAGPKTPETTGRSAPDQIAIYRRRGAGIRPRARQPKDLQVRVSLDVPAAKTAGRRAPHRAQRFRAASFRRWRG